MLPQTPVFFMNANAPPPPALGACMQSAAQHVSEVAFFFGRQLLCIKRVLSRVSAPALCH